MSVPGVCHDVIDWRESQCVVDNGRLGFNKIASVVHRVKLLSIYLAGRWALEAGSWLAGTQGLMISRTPFLCSSFM